MGRHAGSQHARHPVRSRYPEPSVYLPQHGSQKRFISVPGFIHPQHPGFQFRVLRKFTDVPDIHFSLEAKLVVFVFNRLGQPEDQHRQLGRRHVTSRNPVVLLFDFRPVRLDGRIPQIVLGNLSPLGVQSGEKHFQSCHGRCFEDTCVLQLPIHDILAQGAESDPVFLQLAECRIQGTQPAAILRRQPVKTS